MRRRWWLALVVPGLLWITAGCGVTAPKTTSQLAPKNPPFQVLLKSEVVPVGQSFDPTTVQTSVYNDISVYTASGNQVTLDATKQPILITAYWCPHCQRTLVLLQSHQSKLKQLPVVIATGFAAGTTLKQAVKLEQQEERGLNLKSYQIYYDIDPSYASLVPQGFPTFVFPSNGKVSTLVGEKALSVWQQALS